MKHVLKILGITGADIATQAGITRQAVCQGSPKAERAARVLIGLARLDEMQMNVLREAYLELLEFIPPQDQKTEINH